MLVGRGGVRGRWMLEGLKMAVMHTLYTRMRSDVMTAVSRTLPMTPSWLTTLRTEHHSTREDRG